MYDAFNVVASWTNHKRGIVVRVIKVPHARCTIVFPSSLQGRCMEGVDLSAI